MLHPKYLIGAAIVVLISFYGYSVEMLTDRGYTPPQIMAGRGSIALVLGLVLALVKGQQLLPNRWRPQIARFFITGMASYLTILSYRYLSAASVSLINQLDVPLIIFASVALGQKKTAPQFWLSFWTVLVVLYLVIDARFIDEESLGFIYALISVGLVCTGYFLVKRAINHENTFVICNVFSLSNVVFGGVLMLVTNEVPVFYIKDAWIFITGALSQVSLYMLAVVLYRWFPVEKTRLPYVLATVFVLVLEMLVEQKYSSISQIGLTLLITGMLITIIRNPTSPEVHINWIKRNKPLESPEKEVL